MTAGHFIFIPADLLIGLVVGWILGSRAARDAFAAELRRREEKSARTAEKRTNLQRPTATLSANTSGSPASMIFACASSTGYFRRYSSTRF